MSPDFIVGVLIVVVVAVFISIFLRASIRQQSSIDRNELQQNISRQTSDLQNIFTPQLETLITQQQGHLKELREGNEKQLEEIRKTVDEKLRDELDKRLESGFEKVQGFLSQIGKGLGEMRQMSADVGNLQKVLTNVKTRGNWGELQLEAILEDYLAPGQFEKNKVTESSSKYSCPICRNTFATKRAIRENYDLVKALDTLKYLENKVSLLETPSKSMEKAETTSKEITGETTNRYATDKEIIAAAKKG